MTSSLSLGSKARPLGGEHGWSLEVGLGWWQAQYSTSSEAGVELSDPFCPAESCGLFSSGPGISSQPGVWDSGLSQGSYVQPYLPCWAVLSRTDRQAWKPPLLEACGPWWLGVVQLGRPLIALKLYSEAGFILGLSPLSLTAGQGRWGIAELVASDWLCVTEYPGVARPVSHCLGSGVEGAGERSSVRVTWNNFCFPPAL